MGLRVVVLGATGVFGSRIAARLAHDERFELLLAGRRAAPLEGLRAAMGDARVRIHALDTAAADFPAELAALRPQLVIHAAGPFQGQDYRVAEACIDAGSDYVDLADGRDFVSGFSRLDERARRAGRLLVSGASSVPALSSAVVDALLPEFGALDAIEYAINPGNRTPRGDATVASILGYCGRPIRLWRDGRWDVAHGWLDSRRQWFPFGHRRVGVCDIPDLALFPARYPQARSVVFRAGLELPLLQWATWGMGVLVRLGLIRDLARHAPALRRMSEWFVRFGSDVGGMAVELRGSDGQGSPLHLCWWLEAGEGDGPQVPATPAVVLARRLADGLVEARGAMPCMGLLTLGQIVEGFDGFALRTGIRTAPVSR
ncbi:saccharopine dehydrogenase NADP-binding domain-containing protein [Rhodanobacter sp. DHB23]|uniref:saccharopine dehydrogenase family protein n=1 Tax=Rhodanobacter sp. DHB23 TaxID=2775923 RepID=UPI00178141C7|nr:saccharopine dehydrogenase NADP-binding domain-containing protein [Rhodanobacter sp. DHB23]MBD8874328.1 saccharopine dehydrogenase NADP-binding domain-containing protein [Rhodanobacter sp. DHB23]